ncbi:hypothetical protein GCM10023322_59460 [Rugosimonospora acidiphila]|uniref:Anti-sigma factor antagonist n=1 Tax=Rugosimonospora acidiphila TaxID=556531 RepID=A0ABP9SEN6_9ACTN
MDLSVSASRSGDTTRLSLTGEVDLSTVDALQEEIAASVEAEDVASLIIDLSGVTFLDSSGISALLKGRRLADDRQKTFRVEAARDMVREVLNITGVWEHLAGRP